MPKAGCPRRRPRWVSRSDIVVLFTCLALSWGAPPARVLAEDLKEPYEFRTGPNTHLLETELMIKQLETSYEYWTKKSDTCYNRTTQQAKLRMYGFRNPGNACGTNTYCYDFPGPTYRVRRASTDPPVTGDRYHLTLHNELLANQPMGCSDATTPYTWDVLPNCFHGAEVTNHHFHGFHVSPNANDDDTYQDYIYLKLYPDGSNVKPNPPSKGKPPYTEVGTAEYKLDPLGEGQHEGTHWYHPHKHGATAVQVGNGMAGVFIVEGPYDDWIREQVCKGETDCELEEQILVIQNIVSDFKFPPSAGNPTFRDSELVNGQLYPTVHIAPGEVQRWRILNAAMKAGSAFYFVFPHGLEVRQIAMDGVPFVKDNYDRQPLLGAYGKKKKCVIPKGDDPPRTGPFCILMQPGNRVDALVKRPVLKQKEIRKFNKKLLESYAMSLVHESSFFSPQTVDRTEQNEDIGVDAELIPPPNSECDQTDKPGLFKLNAYNKPRTQSMHMPDSADGYPSMPSLADIGAVSETRSLPYQMTGYTGAKFPVEKAIKGFCKGDLLKRINKRVGECSYLLPQFTIEGKKFEAETINQTMQLGAAEQWTFPNAALAPNIPLGSPDCPKLATYLTDKGCEQGEASICDKGCNGGTVCLTDTFKCTTVEKDGKALKKVYTVTMELPVPKPIQHPVHIHINPFQVTSQSDGRKSGPPYVWQDVMGLDTSRVTANNATMKTKFLDFSGEFVMHCHILGHEDRGMMQNLSVEPAKQ